MVYKIQPDSNDKSFSAKMAELGNFCIVGSSYFVHCSQKLDLLKDFLNCSDITLITSLNYKSVQNDIVQKWCYENICADVTKDFENSDEGQKKLRIIMAYLDAIEEKRRKEENNIVETENNDSSNPTSSTASNTFRS